MSASHASRSTNSKNVLRNVGRQAFRPTSTFSVPRNSLDEYPHSMICTPFGSSGDRLPSAMPQLPPVHVTTPRRPGQMSAYVSRPAALSRRSSSRARSGRGRQRKTGRCARQPPRRDGAEHGVRVVVHDREQPQERDEFAVAAPVTPGSARP